MARVCVYCSSPSNLCYVYTGPHDVSSRFRTAHYCSELCVKQDNSVCKLLFKDFDDILGKNYKLVDGTDYTAYCAMEAL